MASLLVLVGAGPSLDYAASEIPALAARGARFFVSDSVAAAFLKSNPGISATVFSVELRRHNYLARIAKSGISPFSVMAYVGAHERNLRVPASTAVTRFKLAGEAGNLLELYSPGTVLGVMLSCAVQVAKPPAEIHVLGADFSFIDNQVYSRYIDPHAPQGNRLATRETWQLVAAYKKTAGVIVKNGISIRTSFELMQARENMRALIDRLPTQIKIKEYSPVGFDMDRVEKCIPVA